MGRIRCVSLIVLVSIILISCTATNRYALVIANADYNELRGRLGDECDLRLMSVNTADDLMSEGRNLVIVALVGTNLHIRIFNATGKRVVDKAENELMSGDTLTTLKKQLNPLPDESRLSQEQKQKIIQDVTSIAGHTLGDVPKKDAYDIENKLSDLGFIVEQKLNLTGKQMQEAILNFAIKLHEGKEGKIGIIYYSGHGTEKEGTTYLIPVNAYLNTQQIDQLISLNTLINTMDDIDGGSAKIVILDACQDDGSGKIGRLAKPIDFPSTLVAYAALPGKTASNEPTEDGNSLYAKALLEALNKRGRSAQNVFNEVKKRVAELSSGRQQPYHSQSGPLDFVFNPFRGLNIPQAAH